MEQGQECDVGSKNIKKLIDVKVGGTLQNFEDLGGKFLILQIWEVNF